MKNRKARNEAGIIFVSLYDTNRCYGGPEEGGWWYDCGLPIWRTSETFFNEDKAYARCRELNAWCNRINKGKGPYGDIGSVLCEGALCAQADHGHAPQCYPDHTPHYE